MSKKRRSSLKENEQKLGKIRGPNGHRLCRFCHKEVSPPRQTFCSDACVHEWRLRSSYTYLKTFVYQRDLGICSKCGVDTRYIRIELEDAAKASMLDSGKWYWLDNQIYIEVCKKHKLTVKESMKSLWQADHIIPVAMGGGETDLSNFESLCIPCHKVKSKEDLKKIKKYQENK